MDPKAQPTKLISFNGSVLLHGEFSRMSAPRFPFSAPVYFCAERYYRLRRKAAYGRSAEFLRTSRDDTLTPCQWCGGRGYGTLKVGKRY